MKENIIIKMGSVRSTLVFTIISVILSLLLTICIYIVLHRNIEIKNLIFPVIVPLIIAPPMILYHVRLIIKISELEKQTRSLAVCDQLTKLSNRHGLYESAHIIQGLSIRNKKPFSLLYCDLDHFKKINDKYGHEAGDIALQETSKIIQKHKRKSDIAARLGGEEFLLVLAETNKTNAMVLAKRIKNELSQLKIKYKSEIIRLTTSIGISDNANNLNISFDHLVSKADKALYISKKNGRNCITIHKE